MVSIAPVEGVWSGKLEVGVENTAKTGRCRSDSDGDPVSESGMVRCLVGEVGEVGELGHHD
jgi:hypothetical protein